ncbi:MAG: FRG domain-containing protein [Olsenella sp.]|jgi:hypothetical protein|nr:FRG domain-containing protein [Olsenella sp.]
MSQTIIPRPNSALRNSHHSEESSPSGITGHVDIVGEAFLPNMADPVIEVPETLDELLDTVEAWDDSEIPCAWRGQADVRWVAVPSLFRRLQKSGWDDNCITEEVVISLEERMVADASKAGVFDSEPPDVLEFMTDVQHYGGATRLLDVTTDYNVALFFACRSCPGVMGNLLRYKVRPSRVLRQGSGATWGDIVGDPSRGYPFLVETWLSNKRIRHQHGLFFTATLAGNLAEPGPFTHQTLDSQVDMIWIRPELKEPALNHLVLLGYTEDYLLPIGVEAFAPTYGVGVPILADGTGA